MSVRSGVFHMTKIRPGLVRLRPSEFFLAVHERDTSTSLRDVALFVYSRSMTEVLFFSSRRRHTRFREGAGRQPLCFVRRGILLQEGGPVQGLFRIDCPSFF